MARKPPPLETRWKPGQSGNPKGKPKGALNIVSAIKREVLATDAEGRTAADIIGEKVVAKAKKGQMDAVHFVADRMDGPLKRVVALEGPTVDALAAQVVAILRAHVPDACPACKAPLDVKAKVIADLLRLAAAATAPAAGEAAGG